MAARHVKKRHAADLFGYVVYHASGRVPMTKEEEIVRVLPVSELLANDFGRHVYPRESIKR